MSAATLAKERTVYVTNTLRNCAQGACGVDLQPWHILNIRNRSQISFSCECHVHSLDKEVLSGKMHFTLMTVITGFTIHYWSCE